MKPQTAGPSKLGMRFFTPELYLRYNSADDAAADQADAQWEQAIADYRQYLNSIRGPMSVQVHRLADANFHDYEILSWEETSDTVPKRSSWGPLQWTSLAMVTLRRQNELTNLVYMLNAPVQVLPAPESWSFPEKPTLWMYDEVEATSGRSGTYLHKILLSDGRVIVMPLVSAFVTHAPLLTTPLKTGR